MIPRPFTVACRFLTFLSVFVGATVESQQDTTWKEGVRITGVYTPGSKPGVLVLPVVGANADSIRAILERDFDYGNRINVIALPATEVPPPNADGTLNYPLLARLRANVVLKITVASYGVNVAVHSTGRGQLEQSKTFALPTPALSPAWRLALHNVSDEVEQAVTGVRGIASTRILFVSAGRVWAVDSDGEGLSPLTQSIGALTPIWHPKASHIAYTSMTDAGATVVLREAGGATRTLTYTPGGTSYGPAFSPDGSTMVYAHGKEAGTDLYAVNAFGSDPARRITVGRGSDNSSPTFSPDGRRIAFTTNRAGHVDVYISDADGTNATPLLPFTFGDQLYRSDPDWSPDGRLIAFQSQIAGSFQIMTVGVRDGTVRRLTSERVNENPSWAPDSRHLVFTSNRTGSRQIWIIDTESSRTRQVTRGAAGARMAAWSAPLRWP